MGIFDRFRKKTGAVDLPKADEKVSKEHEAVARHAAKLKDAPESQAVKATGAGEMPFRLLRTPHISEKAARLAEAGTYVFDVPADAEKIAIRKAVEQLYKVNVVSVRTIRHEGKPIYRGRRPGRRASWKKALVTIKQGQVIDLYEGV
jgi:large subunit ribosomal protein L23